MKTLILTLIAASASTAAFAQGKINFQTDINHLAYFDPTIPLSVAGQVASSDNAPIPLSVDLYMGTSSTALSLYSSTTLFNSTNPGKWNTVAVQAANPFIAGGTSVFVITQIRNSSAVPEQTLDAGNTVGAIVSQNFFYFGWSQVFTFTLGSSVTYPAMYNSPTWAPGTYDLSAQVAPGAKGAVMISILPEPSGVALCSVGAASMLILRRRK